MVFVSTRIIRTSEKLKLYSETEWEPLHKIVVGTATNAHFPVHCKDFRTLEQTTNWKESPVPSGPISETIIKEANQDLDVFCSVLRDFKIEVVRPTDLDFQAFDGMYNYCPA